MWVVFVVLLSWGLFLAERAQTAVGQSGEKRYYVAETPRSWLSAKENCTLAAITSVDVQLSIHRLVRQANVSGSVWIGAERLLHNRRPYWEWVDSRSTIPWGGKVCKGDNSTHYRPAHCGALPPVSAGGDRAGCLMATYNCVALKRAICVTNADACPKETFLVVDGNCFFTPPSEHTWFQARYTCAQMGARLAQDLRQEQYLSLAEKVNNKTAYWIGAGTGQWIWTASGQPVVYSNWRPKTPFTDTSTCAEVDSATGLWRSGSSCRDVTKRFVCETTADENSSTPSLLASDSSTPVFDRSCKELSTGVIAGAAVAVLCVKLLAVALVLFIRHKRRTTTKRPDSETSDSKHEKSIGLYEHTAPPYEQLGYNPNRFSGISGWSTAPPYVLCTGHEDFKLCLDYPVKKFDQDPELANADDVSRASKSKVAEQLYIKDHLNENYPDLILPQ